MNIKKALQRDRKYNKRKNGMVVDSKSVLNIERIQKERAEKIREEREKKQKLLEIIEE